MPRYFVAIPPSDDVRDQLVRAQPAALAGLRIALREELHVTLHFLGEVSDDHAGELRRALGDVQSAPIELSISGVGWFSQPSGAVFFYARVEPAAGLLELHRRIGAALGEAIGFQIEQRPYVPHITLARCESALPLAEIEKLAQTFAHLQIDSMSVDCFSLYSSEWVNGVPRYCEQETYQLASPNSQ